MDPAFDEVADFAFVNPRHRLDEARIGTALMADLHNLTALLGGRDHRVEIGPRQAHRLFAVEILLRRDHVEIERRVEVARDRGHNGVDLLHFEQGLPLGRSLGQVT